ncbi:Glucosyltransferase-like protein [Ascosphaera pollenicola]|nr:Glucosyltransferase-like protein [Ascosphaera pollenicola]
MMYADPALYLLEVVAMGNKEYKFAAVPTPMRVRVRPEEDDAIVMKGDQRGRPRIVKCPAGELNMAGWLHVLSDDDICDGTNLTLQEVRSMHFYKGRDNTEKAAQLTFVPTVDFGSRWKISRGLLGELPWTDVVLVDEVEKFLGGDDERLSEHISGWQKWCEGEYVKLFELMWKKEKEWGVQESWCAAIEEAYSEDKKRSVQELVDIVENGDMKGDEA